MMKILLSILAGVMCSFSYGQNVGINTSAPQDIFHIDAGEDNPSSGVPNVDQSANDLIVTSEGRLGIGTIEPLATMEVRAKNPADASLEGVVFPSLSRNRIKSIPAADIIEGTLVFVDDITGYNTEEPAGTVRNVNSVGLYYFNGIIWSKFETTSFKTNGEKIGFGVKKNKFVGEVNNSSSEELSCGKFKFRIFNDNGTYRPQWALSTGTTHNGTIEGSFRDLYVTNQFRYISISRTFSGNATDNTYQNINNSFQIDEDDVFEVFINFLGDEDFYKFTLLRISNAAGIADNYNILTCTRF